MKYIQYETPENLVYFIKPENELEFLNNMQMGRKITMSALSQFIIDKKNNKFVKSRIDLDLVDMLEYYLEKVEKNG